MAPIKNISRRNFIKGIGLASGGLILASSAYSFTDIDKESGVVTEFNPNLFVQLNSDGSLILVASRSEMGQGVRTSLTSVIADEMEADWNKVIIKQATGDSKYGNQNTDGSRSIRTLFQKMRQMGATVKSVLISAAAKSWNVPESECRAENHFVYHSSGKKIGFGDLVDLAKGIEVPKKITLKSPKDFKYIGKTLPSIDVENLSNGSAVFGLDKRIPNMKFAAIKRSPVTFGTIKSIDKTETLKVKGVIDVVEVPMIKKAFGSLGGVAVIATNTWAAFKGREVLKVEWNSGDNKVYNSDTFMKKMTQRLQKTGNIEKSRGNINDTLKSAKTSVEATYQLPHLVHSPMEVPNAVVHVKENTCEVWAPIQAPQTARREVAKFLKTDQKNVTINVTFLGGGFGRKSKPDFIVEAAAVSKVINRPVQVVWSREDDIQHSYYHTVSSQYLKGSLDKKGNVTGWLHRFALPTIGSTFAPGKNSPQPWEARSATDLPYDIPNFQVETAKADAHVRIGWLRSVINIPHGFAINVFADELADKAGKDPLQFRLDLIGKDRVQQTRDQYKYDTAKLKNVLKTAAKNAGYGKKLPKGHAIGLAVHYSFYSHVAAAVEVSMVNDRLKIHNVNLVVDCGTAINRDTIKAQMEGAAIFGMSLAFYGKITAKDGAIEQSNFHDYQMIRMPDVPKINVEIVESNDKPTGVGEPGVPVMAPAIINAIFKATGKRYRTLPLSDHGIV